MDKTTARSCFKKLTEFGVSSVHIGGGEPFLNPSGLENVLDCALESGIRIEYVETNSSWYKDEFSTCRILERFKSKGLDTLLISISPFHMEYIPFSKVKGVIKACSKTGINIFPWMETFMKDLNAFDPSKTHSFEKLISHFGESYLNRIKSRYWIHLGGRAIDTFRPAYPEKPIQTILDENKGSCSSQLLDTSHFHVDLYKNYIPGLCSGIALPMNNLGYSITQANHTLLYIMLNKGITGVYDQALQKGFYPSKRAYISKCDLCSDIRLFFSRNNLFTDELQPSGFYS